MVANASTLMGIGKKATFDELLTVETPVRTKTYEPLPFADIALNVRSMGAELLESKGYAFNSEEYLLDKNSQRPYRS